MRLCSHSLFSLHPSVFGATFRADLFSLFTLVCVFVVAFVRACAHMMRTAHRRSLKLVRLRRRIIPLQPRRNVTPRRAASNKRNRSTA